MNDEDWLLEKYVAIFPQFDEMAADEFSFAGAKELAVEAEDEYGRRLWKPVQVETPSSQLDEIYAKLPARFPALFERMVLTYRWAEVDLGTYRLLANPRGQVCTDSSSKYPGIRAFGLHCPRPALFSSAEGQTWTTIQFASTLNPDGREESAGS